MRFSSDDDVLGVASCNVALAGLMIKKLRVLGYSESLATEAWLRISEARESFDKERDAEGFSATLRRLTELAELLVEFGENGLLVDRIVEGVRGRLSDCLDPPKTEVLLRLETVAQLRGNRH